MKEFIKIGQDMPTEETATEETATEEEQLGLILKAALKSVDKGIDIGIRKGMAESTERGVGGAINTFFGAFFETVSAVSTLSGPGRTLERKIKNQTAFEYNNTKVNQLAKEAFQRKVLGPAMQLYESNFKSFMDIMYKNSKFDTNTLNDNSTLNAMIIEYKGLDLDASTITEQSPYKVILKKLIPLLRGKFEAITTFKESIGEGSNIDFENIGNKFADGIEDPDDVEGLVGLYKATEEWRIVINGLYNKDVVNSEPAKGSGKTPGKPGTPGSGEEKEGESPPSSTASFDEVVRGVRISGLVPGQNVDQNVTGAGGLTIRRSAIGPTEVPVVRLYLTGSTANKISEIGKERDILNYLIRSRQVSFRSSGRNIPPRDLVSSVRTETVLNGAWLTVQLNPMKILELTSGAGTDSVDIMQVKTTEGEALVTAVDHSLIDDLIKISSGLGTTPFYETVSPSGERVAFTPTDLVMGGGKIKDSSGKTFKPKRYKGKSLAKRVMSPGYGKVKTGFKSKKKK